MKGKSSLLLLAGVVTLILLAFYLAPRGVEFGGTDAAAESLITEIYSDYQPWFQPIFEPAGSEVESLLFTLQGSFGAAVIFYILGYYRGKKQVAE
ncbi:energy-coupling factor ABC transporter substrate-binding protein [Streptococcus danieliae]|uniref:Cobalt transport protein CbiN n=1 Tax=Streptococcus danieliae TaxID=747656 RepID=A0A7Z0M4J1_9STRE|nr:energy-coupling factor ABC transporter substrate-binding protein [Streptococcus danieliae]MBF0698461.1 energy-coupling factor ABC transporter substrate-binding protein [Streptococcus danieliae]MVX58092.1 energy-coupling factor ABC transporter substrate-binding protein [Streptococcus danieliae]NYS95638.1 energy-coupling factor ABC transporter substrate-binding protein [Streptococcus danieliae]